MIGIIDYGMGNLHSVQNACRHLGMESVISSDAGVLENCDRLILPGVGAFGDMMDNLEKADLIPFIRKQVLEEKKPLLGICLGMQALFESSEENGLRQGLGFLQGKVIRMKDDFVRIPQIGWNELILAGNHPLKQKLSARPFAYFDHSYYAEGFDPAELIAYCQYGPYVIPGLVQKDNIVGSQFHPEKSGKDGLAILEWFGKELQA